MDVNTATRSNSGNSTTSIGSTGSEFVVNDVKGQVGHLNGSTVTKGTANQKPSSFFGWLKSLFGFGENNAAPIEPKVAQAPTQNWGRIAQKSADMANAAAQQAPNSIEAQKCADMSREAANKAAGEFENGDINQAKSFSEEAKWYAEKAASLTAVEIDKKENLRSDAFLKKFSSTPAKPQNNDEFTAEEVAELAVSRNISQNEGLSTYLAGKPSDQSNKIKTEMVKYKKLDSQGTKISLEDSQQRAALAWSLKQENIVYNHQKGMFLCSDEAKTSVLKSADAINDSTISSEKRKEILEEQAINRSNSFKEEKNKA